MSNYQINKDSIINLIKWGIILVIVILLLKECGSTIKSLVNLNKPKPDTTIIHKIDTVFAKDTIYKFKGIKVPVPYIIHDTIVNIDGKDTCTNIKVYEDSLVDKNISIYYKDYISQGTLLGKDLEYKLKVPLRITDSITTTIKIPTLYHPTFQLNAGLTAGSSLFAPTIGVSYKRHNMFVGYNLSTKQPILGYSFVLFRK